MRELLHCDVLIYDDLGVKTLDKSGRPTGYTAFAEDLTDRCYDTGKTLIITTNLPKEFFRRAHGSRDVDRIVSRLREMTLQPIVFTGDDMREIIGRETIEALSKH